ncbi:MAG: hypothetical protein JW716_04140 [Candidatus Aenigmarchaeota archaeon]|nr:hypothetical protein [Candidatus Aenigmarchaeota archaeon]
MKREKKQSYTREGYCFQLIADTTGVTHLRVYDDGEYKGPMKRDRPETEEFFYLTPKKADSQQITGLPDLLEALVDKFSELDNRISEAGVKFPVDYTVNAIRGKRIYFSSSDAGYIGALFRSARKAFQ